MHIFQIYLILGESLSNFSWIVLFTDRIGIVKCFYRLREFFVHRLNSFSFISI